MLCCNCSNGMFLGKTVFRIRQKGVPPLLLPASVLQLPRCLVRICNLFHKGNQIANWQVSKSAIAAGKTDCKIKFAPQMWAARPHLGSIFEKLLHQKTFMCLRLGKLQPTSKNGSFLFRSIKSEHLLRYDKRERIRTCRSLQFFILLLERSFPYGKGIEKE